MFRAFALKLAFCIPLLMLVGAAKADGPPSSGAKDMAGALGTFEFEPSDRIPGQTTWWKDTDGVGPGEAGCHIGTDPDGKPNGRMFGEACLSDVLLVESNPGSDVIALGRDPTLRRPAGRTSVAFADRTARASA